MIKINLSSAMKHSFCITTLLVLFSFQVKAQNSGFLQEAMQACLEHREVRPYLQSVSFENAEDVLVVQKNRLTPTELKLFMFGKEAYILDKQSLFFYSIENFVAFTDIRTKRDKITVTFTTGAQFTCTYLAKKGKVKKLEKDESKQ